MSDRRSGIERRKEGQRRRRRWVPGMEDMPERRSGKGRRGMEGRDRRCSGERRFRDDVRAVVRDTAIQLVDFGMNVSDAENVAAAPARGRFGRFA